MAREMLSPHFALAETGVSASHPRLARPVPARYYVRAKRLAETVLEPMRVLLGRPFHVLSWYRTPTLNRAVGGSATSQHVHAEAADIDPSGRARQVFRAMMLRPVKYPTGQVIYYPDRHFLHIALASTRYPTPTFCLHWPAEGFTYHVLRDAAELDAILRRYGRA
jgi:zinc D-Ala-D-Ala carboxypeptidase